MCDVCYPTLEYSISGAFVRTYAGPCLSWGMKDLRRDKFFVTSDCVRVSVCSYMRTAGLISLSCGLLLTSSSSILQSACVCAPAHTNVCFGISGSPPASKLFIISLCVLLLYHLPCVCVCVYVYMLWPDSLWFLWLLITGSHSLSVSPFFNSFPLAVLLCGCLVWLCVCVCTCVSVYVCVVLHVLDRAFDRVIWTLWVTLTGWAWMEGLGYPSGHAICHGGTTLAPISSTQVSSEAESATEVRFESSSSNNNNMDRRSFHGEQSFS